MYLKQGIITDIQTVFFLVYKIKTRPIYHCRKITLKSTRSVAQGCIAVESGACSSVLGLSIHTTHTLIHPALQALTRHLTWTAVHAPSLRLCAHCGLPYIYKCPEKETFTTVLSFPAVFGIAIAAQACSLELCHTAWVQKRLSLLVCVTVFCDDYRVVQGPGDALHIVYPSSAARKLCRRR